MPKHLVDKKYLMHKYPGKGGWTYVVIDEINPTSGRGSAGCR